jgi:nitrile hydratase accessory protein
VTEVEILEDSLTAPPRLNGELVFEAPWQSRAFGVTADLVESGCFSWGDFRKRLIAAIGAWESTDDIDRPTWDYYTCWTKALEQILNDLTLLDEAELDGRAIAYAERPHGHDH